MFEIWDGLDQAIWEEVERMRGRTGPDTEQGMELAKKLTHLPARLGGVGLLSHRDCSAHAYAAANEASDAVLRELLGATAESRGTERPATRT